MLNRQPLVYALSTVLSLCLLLSGYAYSKTLVIKGSNADAGDVIELPAEAAINVAVSDDDITLTLPGLDVRLRCLGEATAEGYCYIAAGSGGGSLVDTDGDGVVDDLDSCPTTTPPGVSVLINKEGCADVDDDGYFENEDDCPTEGGNVDSTGCPVSSPTTYTITSSAGPGGSISPSGSVSVSAGATRTFTLSASAGYEVASVGGTCGGSISGGNYTTAPINSNCTVQANFRQTTTPVGGYCDDAPADVADVISCSSGQNFDSWPAKTAYYSQVAIPSGKILSFPFTTADSTTDNGKVDVNTLEGDLGAKKMFWRSWFSVAPGGAVLNNSNVCQKLASKALLNFNYTQSPSGTGCNLGTTGQVLHLNFEVRCFPEYASCTPGTRYDQPYWMELSNDAR